ncbi:ras GEF [Linnemannia elongata AG-77]|uniref:Ras GEF n=1 Tax=Linnemannia elongata AG-77 TaxID=1314771 RepID=A0A197JSI6_9FUNG|nr:ras GEF [Linnemannia elongata AG-77]
MVSEGIDVQVLVRAMYDFHSEDPTNLTFQRDDVIQVLAQLDSGWWAGLIDGRQGWFPSNYVEVLDENDLDSEEGDEYVEGDDLDSADDLWLPQTTPDGQVFYYNQRTQESSWTIPEQDAQTSENDTTETASHSRAGKFDWSARQSTSNGNGWYNSEAEDDETDNGPDSFSKQGDTDNRSELSQPNDANNNEAEHVNHSEEHGGENKSLAAVRKPSGAPGAQPDAVDGLPPLPLLPNPFDPEPSWESLAEHTAAAVQNLLNSADNGYKPYYLIQSSIVVEAIRVMLYASGTVDKDAAIMRQHRGLKMHHRQIMAALSKLVLSAKMASGVWTASDAVIKLQADAREVGTAAQNYVSTAIAANIEVHQVDARLVTNVKSPLGANTVTPQSLQKALSNGSLKAEPPIQTTSERKVFGSQMSTQSILSQLDYYSKSASKAVNTLAMQIEKLIDNPRLVGKNSQPNGASAAQPVMNATQSAQLVTQARQTITQLGSLLSLVTEFSSTALTEQPSIPDRYFSDVKVAKQVLHGGTASLVMAIQSATDLLAVGQTLELALSTTLSTGKAAESLVQATRVLVQEKETADTSQPTNTNTHSDSYSNGTLVTSNSGSAYDHDNDSDIEPDAKPRSTGGRPPQGMVVQRNRSDSQPSVLSGHHSSTGQQTPGSTEYSGRSTQAGYPFPTGDPSVDGRANGGNFANSNSPGRFDNRGEKVKKLLGDEAPVRAATQQWFLDYDYQTDDLVLNGDGQVKGGTLPALIERLTLHDGFDATFVATFLLTYRSFTNTKELFSLLFQRFTIQPPLGLNAEELEIWTEKKLTPIRLRVFNIMKSWLENYYLEDEEDDREALTMIKVFSESPAMMETMRFAALQLAKTVEKRQASDSSFRKLVLNLTTQAPQPITPRNLKRIKFLELDPLEFARQLTIMEAAVYNKIRPVECLNKAWSSEDPVLAAKAVNIKKMIETSNLYANWINELVLSEKELKKRVLVIRHLVTIAERLRQMNDFSMLSNTVAALLQSPVHRLKRTWEQVPAKTMSTFMELQQLMSVNKNWVDYREELHSANPPCVPFVGMYLTDLVMIYDGNKDAMKQSNHLINFNKRIKTAEVIREIQQYQSVPYCLTTVPEIQQYIRRGMDGAKHVQDLHEMSLALEPRERGDEKIARMMAESGML